MLGDRRPRAAAQEAAAAAPAVALRLERSGIVAPLPYDVEQRLARGEAGRWSRTIGHDTPDGLLGRARDVRRKQQAGRGRDGLHRHAEGHEQGLTAAPIEP